MKFTPRQFVNHVNSLKGSFEAEVSISLIQMASFAENVFDNNFENEKFAGGGGKWKKNEQSTIDKKNKGGGNKKILEDSGKLRDSREKQFFTTSAYKGVRIQYTGLTHRRGSGIFDYAKAMNEGFVHKQAGKIPARPFIGYMAALDLKLEKILRGSMRKLFSTNFNLGR